MTPAIRTPLLARALLAAVAGDTEAEYVAGDLEEEFAQRRERFDSRAANRWYAWQVVRSMAPLLGVRVRSGELLRVVLGGVVATALPLILLDRLWCSVYSQIPLKDGVDRAPGFLAANLAVLCICAAINGALTRSLRQVAANAVATAVLAGLAMWASVGSAPFVYAFLMLVLAPASLIVSTMWRRSV
jgi:hypothetical protein